jgi:hypothetical protein
MYDCDDYSESCISQFPFNEKGFVSKVNFIKHCNKRRHLIQPAINYQRKLRKRVGGILYWGLLEDYRKKTFNIQDSESPSLDEALEKILLYEDIVKRSRKVAAETALLYQKEKLEEEEIQRQIDWQDLVDKQKKEEQLRTVRRDDWMVTEAWELYYRRLKEFEEDPFHSDEIWERQEARLELFALLDEAADVTRLYWVTRELTDVVLTEGTYADHEARLKDYLETEDGQLNYKFDLTKNVLEDLASKINAKKLTRGKDKYAQSANELSISTCLLEMSTATFKSKPKYGRSFLEVEEALIKQLGSKAMFLMAEKKTYDNLHASHKKRVLNALQDHQENQRNVRKKEHLKEEHYLVSTHGPRTTRWEYVLCEVNKWMVYINVDTLEVRHRNSAICENCDYIMKQYDQLCLKCESKRSTKNGLLFRPYGYKDLCAD